MLFDKISTEFIDPECVFFIKLEDDANVGELIFTMVILE